MVGTPASTRSLRFGALCAPRLRGPGSGPREIFGKEQLVRCDFLQSGACFQCVFFLRWYPGSTSRRNVAWQPGDFRQLPAGAYYPEPPYVLHPWVNPFQWRIIFRTGFPAKIHCFRGRPHICCSEKKKNKMAVIGSCYRPLLTTLDSTLF